MANMQTIGAFGVAGWSAIVDANMQELNSRFSGPFAATDNMGTTAITNSSVTLNNPGSQTSATLTDSSGGTPGATIIAVSGTGDDTTINNNLASLTDQVNKLTADLAESRTREQEYKDAIASLESKVNTLLAELRITNGCGVLND